MQFLKTLFWVAVAVLVVLFARENWDAVTLNLWGGLQADVKLPALVLAAFLIGFLPMLIFHRARMWSLRRRLEALQRQVTDSFVQPAAEPARPVAEPAAPPPDSADRIATDSKAWPAA